MAVGDPNSNITIDNLNQRLTEVEYKLGYFLPQLPKEVKPEELFEDARNFWKNNNKDYSAEVGQITGLLADYGAYILNKNKK